MASISCTRRHFLTAALFLTFVHTAASQTKEWAVRYIGAPGSGSDYLRAATTDGSGNIYVAGGASDASSKGYGTVKYDPAGSLLWDRIYQGPGSGEDEVLDIAIDSAGAVCVTGSSHNGSNYDAATVKYSSAGTPLWERRYNNGSDDDGQRIAIDASNNVVIAGSAVVGSNYRDYLLIKYSSGGTQLWIQTFNGPAGTSLDEARDMTMDAFGNIYVSGVSYATSSGADYATLKYNSSGALQWARRYTGAGNNTDEGTSIAVDAAQNVYVTGYSRGSSSNDYATIKYTASGTEQWVARYNPANGEDRAYRIAVDGAGNVFVTGEARFGPHPNIATIKYDSSGTQVWVASYNGPGEGPDVASAIMLGAGGSIYVAGSSTGNLGYEDFLVVKYNSSGVALWSTPYDGETRSEQGPQLALDIDGNIIMAGTSEGATTGWDFATVKVSDCAVASPDCNSNGSTDSCDIAEFLSADCNTNGIPDECDTAVNPAEDCDRNTVPDACEAGPVSLQWIGVDGAAYGLSSNWNPAGPPKGTTRADLTHSGPSDRRCLVATPGITGVCDTLIQASGDGRQILQVDVGARFHSTNGMTIGSKGEVDLRGGTISGGPVLNSSNTVRGWGVIDASLTNTGLVSAQATRHLHLAGADLDNQAGGTILANGGAEILIDAAAISQAGGLEARTLALFACEVSLTNLAGGTITLLGGSVVCGDLTNVHDGSVEGFGTIDGNVDNQGTIVAIADLQIVGDLHNDGTITIQGGVLTVTGDLSGGGVIIGGFGG